MLTQPENFPAGEVPRVNALLKLATTAAILLGIALGGFVLDLSSAMMRAVWGGVDGCRGASRARSGGKSGHHKAGKRVTPAEGDFRGRQQRADRLMVPGS